MDINTVLDYFTRIEEKLSQSTLVIEAKKDLLKSLTNSSLTQEKRTQLIQQFSEQIALNFANIAMDKAMQIDSVIADIDLKASQKAKYTADIAFTNEQKGLVTLQKATEAQKLENEKLILQKEKGSAYKQLGLTLTTLGWSNAGNGLVDKQIKGFAKDMDYKIVKSLSEQAGMLAQNDVATPVLDDDRDSECN